VKIYCILFDTCPQNQKIEDLFNSKNLHYSNYITNSWTGTTLMSMFSGKTPSELKKYGVGYEKPYISLSEKDKKIWNKKMIFNNLPDDWKIHIHAMPETRGDAFSFRFVPDEICGIDRDVQYYDYKESKDEKSFIRKMQKLPSDENHFIFLKYNHYHNQMNSDTIDDFCKIIDSINFKEENSLFWIFSDHGHWTEIDELMTPPHAWLTWVSVTDNIKNKKVSKDIIYNLDFYNTIMNRIYNNQTEDDILSELDINRIYVSEDGRSGIDNSRCTTVSAIKYLNNNKFVQMAYHKPTNIMRTIIFYNRSRRNNLDLQVIPDDSIIRQGLGENNIVCNRYELSTYLKSDIWKWYFENE